MENKYVTIRDIQNLNKYFICRGVTHKKTIIEYCESKIKAASNNDMVDRASYILLYELMIMLIQQNGVSLTFFRLETAIIMKPLYLYVFYF